METTIFVAVENVYGDNYKMNRLLQMAFILL